MKKALTMIASVIAAAACLSAMAVSADVVTETQKGDTVEAAKWTLTEKYFAVSYTMPLAEKAGAAGNNGCCGIIFGGTDDYLCVFLQHDDDADGQKACNKSVHVGPWWGNNNRNLPAYDVIADDDMGKDGTVLVLGSQEGGKLTVDSIYFNGKKIDDFAGITLEGYNGQVGYATKLTDVEVTVKLLESATALDATAFDEKTEDPGKQDPTTQDPGTQDPTTQDPGKQPSTTPDDPGKTPESNPKTGSASVVIAAVAVVALAGAVVATKKREQD